ncbi:MAG: GNAT family N-acetyltransferase [Acholeplasma sp.]|nr:GNAT family N-acetyltransferase [Acholeplasma sp.]
MLKTIETQRLVLRAPNLSDLDDFYHYASKENIGIRAGWLPHESLEESKLNLISLIEKEEVWAITIKPTNQLVGTIGLHIRDFFDAINGIAELGYSLDDKHWNHGYMTEAVKAILNTAFDYYGFKKIVCGHQENNKASQKVILKNGFHFTNIEKNRDYGEFKIKNIYMYELTKDYLKENENE